MLACPRCRATFADDVTACPDDGTTLLPGDLLTSLDVPLEPGTMVGEYRVDAKLGSGTFGDVYAGEQPVIGKRVAIKLLHRKFSSDPEVVSRFVAEARAVNRIRHKNIIDIFSFGLLGESRHYFVMELLDGLTLGELLAKERRLPLEKALPILRGIASGLDAAHEAGITHRDLKPDNVFLALERDGTYFPKLLDFGVAKLLPEDVAHRTATGMAIGTPRYMSPEQCRGKKVDARSDVYSLGVLVHEVLTGRPLFEGESSMDILFSHTSERPPAMSAVRAELPPELDEPVLAMLAKRPKDRPASAGEAIAQLAARVKEAHHAATLPASSASAGRLKIKANDDAEDAPSEARTRRDADATVAIRQRTPPATRPRAASLDGTASGTEPRRTERASDVPTVETAVAAADSAPISGSISVAFSSATSAPGDSIDVAFSGSRRSTEVVPVSRVSGTLMETPDGIPRAPVSETAGSEASKSTLRSPATAEVEATTTPGIPVQAQAASPAPRSRVARSLPFLVAGAAALVAGAITLLQRDGATSSATSQAAPAQTVSSPRDRTADSAPPPLSASVKVRLHVTPPEATLVIDGKSAGSASEPLTLPRSTESRAVRVELDGYEPATVWIVPDRDADLPAITLARAPTPVSAATTSEATVPAPGGKPVAKTKLHSDLEAPPELRPHK